MKMKLTIGKIIFVITLITCFAFVNNHDEPKESEFDTFAIENLEKYRKLCEFLEENLEELIEFRNSINYVAQIRSDTVYRELKFDTCHTLVRRFSEDGLPDKLETEFYSLIKPIGQKKLLAFTICLNKTIEVTIKGDYVGFFDMREWNQYHRLEYKPKRNLSRFGYQIVKDTTLSEDFRYFIYLQDS